MTRVSQKTVRTGIVVALLAAGSLTTATAASPKECGQIAGDIARAFEAKGTALMKKQNAWKTPLPIAAVGRTVSANEDLMAAEAKLDSLHSNYFRLGCAHDG